MARGEAHLDPGAEQADTARICHAYQWTPQQVADMGPTAQRLALEFLATRTATPRPTLRQRLAALAHRPT